MWQNLFDVTSNCYWVFPLTIMKGLSILVNNNTIKETEVLYVNLQDPDNSDLRLSQICEYCKSNSIKYLCLDEIQIKKGTFFLDSLSYKNIKTRERAHTMFGVFSNTFRIFPYKIRAFVLTENISTYIVQTGRNIYGQPMILLDMI